MPWPPCSTGSERPIHPPACIPAEAAKPVLGRFFAEDALAGAALLARRAMAGAGTVDALSADQFSPW